MLTFPLECFELELRMVKVWFFLAGAGSATAKKSISLIKIINRKNYLTSKNGRIYTAFVTGVYTENYFSHFCEVEHTKRKCCRLQRLSLVSSPLTKIGFINPLVLLLHSLMLPFYSLSDKFAWRETGDKFTARKRVFSVFVK